MFSVCYPASFNLFLAKKHNDISYQNDYRGAVMYHIFFEIQKGFELMR